MTFLLECTVGSVLKCLEEEVRGAIQKEQGVCPGSSSFTFSVSLWTAAAAHRSDHGATTGRFELQHQRPAHLVLRAHQHFHPFPVCCEKAALPAPSYLQSEPSPHSVYLYCFSLFFIILI